MSSTLADNPVLAPWDGPHGGGPAFDRVRVEHFEPALDEAMVRYRAEIAAIAANPDAAHLRQYAGGAGARLGATTARRPR